MYLPKMLMLALPGIVLGQSALFLTATGVSNSTGYLTTSSLPPAASTLQFTTGRWTNSTSAIGTNSPISTASGGQITTSSASQNSATLFTSEIATTSPSSTSNLTSASSSMTPEVSSGGSTASASSTGFGTLLTSGITTTGVLPPVVSESSILPALVTTDAITILTSPLPVITGPPDGDIAPPRDDWLFWFISETESIIPTIEGWIDGSERDIGPDIQIHLSNLKISLDGILPSLGPPKGIGCVASLFNLLKCISDTIEGISGKITGDVTDDLTQLIKTQTDDLKKRITELKNKEYGKDEESIPSSSEGQSPSSTTTESSSSSSQSCTESSTSEAEFTTCSPSPVTSGSITTITEACETSTTTVTGCSISASGSATTLSSPSSPAIASECAWECEACNGKATVKKSAGLAARSPGRVPGERESCGLDAPSLSRRTLDDASEVAGNASLPGRHLDSISLVRRTLDDPSAFEPDLDALPRPVFTFADGVEVELTWPSGIDGYILAYSYDTGGHPCTEVELAGTDQLSYPSSALALFDKGEKVNVLLQGLWGCTSVIVVSRLGVYMSHIWEKPSFIGKIDPDTNEVLPRQFEHDVMYQVPNGGPRTTGLKGQARGEGKPFAIEGAETWAGLQDGNVVRTFIVTPEWPIPGNGLVGRQKPRPGELRYPEDVARIQQALNDWVPNSNPEVVPYPVEYMYEDGLKYRLATTSKGKVLFQYDPKERIDKERRTVDGKEVECDVQKSKLRLMVENRPDPVYTDVWTSPTSGQFVPPPNANDGALPLNQRQASDPPLACRTVAASSTDQSSSSPKGGSTAASSSSDTLNTTSTTPSSTLTASTNSTSASKSTTSSSIIPTILTTAPSITSDASTAVSFESTSFSFTPTTAPTSLSSCGIISLPPSISGNVIFGPVTYCTCNDDGWPVKVSTTTASDGATLSICTLGDAAFTASIVPATTTTEDPPVTTGEPPPPPPTPTPEYAPGTCSVHIFEAANTTPQGVAIQLTVKDGKGSTLWWSGKPMVTKWDEISTAFSVDTKLPWNVDVDPSKLELARLKRRDTNGTSHDHVAVPPPSDTWRMFDVGIVAGASEWTSDDTDEATLPYCSVGDWDDGDFWDFIDPFLPGGREHWSTRDMDCYFEC